jgi:hypothetical protein
VLLTAHGPQSAARPQATVLRMAALDTRDCRSVQEILPLPKSKQDKLVSTLGSEKSPMIKDNKMSRGCHEGKVINAGRSCR